jgi:hypothetical protein
VQVDLEAVGDRVVIDARGQAARSYQRVAVEAGAIGDRAQLAGVLRDCLPRPPQM